MSQHRTATTMWGRSFGEVFGDLALAVGATLVLAGVVEYRLVADGPLRILIGLPLALFLPGYAFMAALFPAAPAVTQGRESGIDWPERIALSFGTSLALVPIVVLAITIGGAALTTNSVTVALTAVVIAGSLVAGVRRFALPEERRLAMPSLPTPSTWGVGRISRPERYLAVGLAISVLLLAASMGYAFAAPRPADPYTDLYILHPNAAGEPVAGGFPTDVPVGTAVPVVVGIDNHESASVTYTVVVQLQRVDGGSVTVVQELDRFTKTVGAGKSVTGEHDVTLNRAGEDYRVAYLLYKGTPPGKPTMDSAYRTAYFWVSVRGA